MQNEKNKRQYKSYRFRVEAIVEIGEDWQAENEEEALEMAKTRVDMGFIEEVKLTKLFDSGDTDSRWNSPFLETLRKQNEDTKILKQKNNEKRKNQRRSL